MAAFGVDPKKFNAAALPLGIFEGCKETEGPTEVITAKSPGRNSWMAIDIISALDFVSGVVAIDGHDMWVYAMDGSYIEPQKVQALTLANGERYSVLVKTERPGDFAIRCHANSAPQTIIGNAILHVPGHVIDPSPPKQYMDIIGNPLSSDVVVFNLTAAPPYPPDPPAKKADDLHVLNMRLDGSSYRWALNSTGLLPETLDQNLPPVLFRPDTAKFGNVSIVTRNDTWVDLVFYASVFPMAPHPIHKHGVKMFEIGSGTGPFKWKSVEEAMKEIPHQFNLDNPPRRDTVRSLPARTAVSWVAVRYHVSNPGAWLLHCHIMNHMVGGMMMVILDGIEAWPEIPPEYLNYS
jgi:FtsP/CotA-like multicopper oxidase with cupredoxin domain